MKQSQVVRFAVLMTCHNRRDLTLASLRGLFTAFDSMKGVVADVFLVDDGSTDGTTEAVVREFPSVTIVAGTGSLYWAGGMSLAYERSRKSSMPEGYVLVNDDVQLDPTAVSELLEHWLADGGLPRIFVGMTTDQRGQMITYGGFSESSKLSLFGFERVAAVSDFPEPCDTFNANFVVVPGDFFRDVGGLDPAYRHGAADLDLGLVARRWGVSSYVWPHAVGVCERGPTKAEILRRLPRRERAARLFVHPYGLAPDLHFAWKHRPRLLLAAYAVHGVLTRIRALFPPARTEESARTTASRN